MRVAYYKRRFRKALLNSHPTSIVARHFCQVETLHTQRPQRSALSNLAKMVPLKKIRCEIRLWDGTVSMLDDLYETDTGGTLKQRIRSKLGLPGCFRVTLSGKDLDDSTTLANTGISDECTVSLNLQIVGGGKSSDVAAGKKAVPLCKSSSAARGHQWTTTGKDDAIGRLERMKIMFDRKRNAGSGRKRRYDARLRKANNAVCHDAGASADYIFPCGGVKSPEERPTGFAQSAVPTGPSGMVATTMPGPAPASTNARTKARFDLQARQGEDSRGRSDRQEHLQHIRVEMGLTEQELLSKLESCAQNERSGTQHSGNGNHNARRGQRNEGNGDDEDDIDNGSAESFFADQLKCPTKSILLYYLNSGLMRFQRHRDYMASWDGKDVDVDALVEEIRSEKLTDVEAQETVRRFLCFLWTTPIPAVRFKHAVAAA